MAADEGDDQDLDLPPDLYRLQAGAAEELHESVPFPADLLTDYDDIGRGLRWIDDDGERRLFAFPRLALLWATVREGQVVAVEVLAGQAAARTWIERGARLPPEQREKILGAVRPGEGVQAALSAAFGASLRTMTTLESDGAAMALAVHSDFPLRSAVLQIEVSPDGRVAAARILEGRAAWEKLSAKARQRG